MTEILYEASIMEAPVGSILVMEASRGVLIANVPHPLGEKWRLVVWRTSDRRTFTDCIHESQRLEGWLVQDDKQRARNLLAATGAFGSTLAGALDWPKDQRDKLRAFKQ